MPCSVLPLQFYGSRFGLHLVGGFVSAFHVPQNHQKEVRLRVRTSSSDDGYILVDHSVAGSWPALVVAAVCVFHALYLTQSCFRHSVYNWSTGAGVSADQ